MKWKPAIRFWCDWPEFFKWQRMNWFNFTIINLQFECTRDNPYTPFVLIGGLMGISFCFEITATKAHAETIHKAPTKNEP